MVILLTAYLLTDWIWSVRLLFIPLEKVHITGLKKASEHNKRDLTVIIGNSNLGTLVKLCGTGFRRESCDAPDDTCDYDSHKHSQIERFQQCFAGWASTSITRVFIHHTLYSAEANDEGREGVIDISSGTILNIHKHNMLANVQVELSHGYLEETLTQTSLMISQFSQGMSPNSIPKLASYDLWNYFKLQLCEIKCFIFTFQLLCVVM